MGIVFVCPSCCHLSALRSKNKNLLILFAIGWGYCLLMTPFILNKTYVIPGVFMLVFASAHSLVNIKYSKNLGGALVLFALVSALILVFKAPNTWYKKAEGDKQRDQIERVNELAAHGKLLIFPGHVFQYYAKDGLLNRWVIQK